MTEPKTAAEYLDRGCDKDDQKDSKGAIEDYNKAIELNPNYAEAYANRGCAKEELGDKEDALADWQKAADLGDEEAAKWIQEIKGKELTAQINALVNTKEEPLVSNLKSLSSKTLNRILQLNQEADEKMISWYNDHEEYIKKEDGSWIVNAEYNSCEAIGLDTSLYEDNEGDEDVISEGVKLLYELSQPFFKAALATAAKPHFSKQVKKFLEKKNILEVDDSYILPKDEYFFGDLGFLFNDSSDWENVFCKNGDGVFQFKNKDYLMIGIGSDGWFRNLRGKNVNQDIPVDSGTLGLIATDTIDPDILEKVVNTNGCGFLYSSAYEVQVDFIDYCGIHVYPKRDLYCGDDAILVEINEEQFDNAYFDSRCKKYSDDPEGNNIEEGDTPRKLYPSNFKELISQFESINEEIYSKDGATCEFEYSDHIKINYPTVAGYFGHGEFPIIKYKNNFYQPLLNGHQVSKKAPFISGHMTRDFYMQHEDELEIDIGAWLVIDTDSLDENYLNFLMPCLYKLIDNNGKIDAEILDVDEEEYKTLLNHFYDLRSALSEDEEFVIENFCDMKADPIMVSS